MRQGYRSHRAEHCRRPVLQCPGMGVMDKDLVQGRLELIAAADDDRVLHHFLPLELAMRVRGVTKGEIADRIDFARAVGRPIDILTARVIIGLFTPPYDVEDPDDEPVRVFADTGRLDEGFWTPFDHQAGLTPLDLCSWVAAAVDCLDESAELVPAVVVHTAFGPSGWIALDQTEEALLDTLRAWPSGEADGSYPVIGYAGAPFPQDDEIAGLTGSSDLWAWHRVRQGIRQWGEAFIAWMRDRLDQPGATEADFERRYRGEFGSRDQFIRQIGLRDGWWSAVMRAADLGGVGGAVTVDDQALWAAYRRAGWQVRGHLWTYHLFAPPWHTGPIPSVAEAQQDADALMMRLLEGDHAHPESSWRRWDGHQEEDPWR